MKALIEQCQPVRAFVHHIDNRRAKETALKFVQGDFFDRKSLMRALDGVDKVFHIGPPHHAGEFAIGQTVVDLRAGE